MEQKFRLFLNSAFTHEIIYHYNLYLLQPLKEHCKNSAAVVDVGCSTLMLLGGAMIQSVVHNKLEMHLKASK